MGASADSSTPGRRVLEILGVAAVYHVGCQLGFLLQSLGTLTSPVWPPSGIAFAALLLFGCRVWPAVFIGAFTANVSGFLLSDIGGLANGIATAFAIAAGNTLAAWLAIVLLRRFVTRDNPFTSARTMFGLVVVTVATCALGATNGAGTLWLGGIATPENVDAVWLTWWLGDTTGVLVMMPLLTAWVGPFATPRVNRSPLEIGLLLAVIVVVCAAVFQVPFRILALDLPLTFLLLPPLLWTSYRFGHRGASVVLLLVSAFAIVATLKGQGPFAIEDQNGSLLLLQGFVGMMGFTMLVVASVVFEREAAFGRFRASQDSLVQAQKMEAVGRLAGGIAHDFNNLLMVIGGHADLMLNADKTPEEWRNHASRIRHASKRAAKLVKQLLAYSRRQVLEPQAMDLNRRVAEVGTWLQRIIGERVDLVIEASTSPATIHADPNSIDRVLLNLSLNARDAMPDGGRLTISTRRTYIDAARAKVRHVEPGEYVTLTVRDTGVGISEAILPDIFDPFFTTKSESSGTGLGLATAYGIVRQSGGFITVDSVRKGGTTFRVFLPKAHDPVVADEITNDPPPARSARGTVLLAEDSGDVRELVANVLSRNGFEVAVACDGAEALQLYKNLREKIVATVTDVVMPQLNGDELVQAIRETDPDAKVLLISGHDAGKATEALLNEPGTRFLQKPFGSNELIRKIAELIEP